MYFSFKFNVLKKALFLLFFQSPHSFNLIRVNIIPVAKKVQIDAQKRWTSTFRS